MSKRTILLAVSASAILAGSAGAIAASRDTDPPQPGPPAPAEVTPAPAAVGPGPASDAPSSEQLSADRRIIEKHYAAFRTTATPSRSTAANGVSAQLTIEPAGLCITPSFGGKACGDPAEAATRPTVLHVTGPDVEYIAGPVPDGVDQVVIDTKQNGRKTIDAQDNVFAAEISPGAYAGLTWRMRNGETRRPASR